MLSGRGRLSSAAAKEVTDGRDRARGSPAAPKAGPEAEPGAEPATAGCGGCASDAGKSDIWLGIAHLQLPVSTDPDALLPSTLSKPESRITFRGVGQGKLTEAVSLPGLMGKAANRAEIKATEAELAKMFTRGAKGTKDGPGRSTSRGPVRPPLRPHPPTPSKGNPDDLWAAVRARRAALQAADALRERDLPEMKMHRERMSRISKERWQRSERSRRGLEGLSSGEGPIVRV